MSYACTVLFCTVRVAQGRAWAGDRQDGRYCQRCACAVRSAGVRLRLLRFRSFRTCLSFVWDDYFGTVSVLVHTVFSCFRSQVPHTVLRAERQQVESGAVPRMRELYSIRYCFFLLELQEFTVMWCAVMHRCAQGEREVKNFIEFLAQHATNPLQGYDRSGKPVKKSAKSELWAPGPTSSHFRAASSALRLVVAHVPSLLPSLNPTSLPHRSLTPTDLRTGLLWPFIIWFVLHSFSFFCVHEMYGYTYNISHCELFLRPLYLFFYFALVNNYFSGTSTYKLRIIFRSSSIHTCRWLIVFIWICIFNSFLRLFFLQIAVFFSFTRSCTFFMNLINTSKMNESEIRQNALFYKLM